MVPPQSNTGATILQPRASVTVVCTATAWKMEAAIFSLDIFLAIRFCMSVLQNTPQREAIEYTDWNEVLVHSIRRWRLQAE